MSPLTRSKLATFSKFALGLFWLALFTATHLPPTSHLLTAEVNDKVEHALAYAIFALLLATTWELAARRRNGLHLAMAWLGIAAYAALDEITQIPVGRDCEFGDWAADACGAAVGLLLFVALRKLLQQRSSAKERQ